MPSSLEYSHVQVLSCSCCQPQGNSEAGVHTPTSVPARRSPVPGSTSVSVLLAVRVGGGREMSDKTFVDLVLLAVVGTIVYYLILEVIR